jgi:hypothetical protein
MRIAFVGGHWSANIGNAYYNLGAMYLLQSIVEHGNVFLVPDPPQWRHKVQTDFDLISNLDVDLVLFGGPILNLRFVQVLGKTIEKLSLAGVRWGFLSAGMALYDSCEVEAISQLLVKYPPEFCFTRDSLSYQFFRPVIDNCFDGICTSAFLDEGLIPPRVKSFDYVIANLDHRTPDTVAFKAILDSGYNDLNLVWTVSEGVEAGEKVLYKRQNSYYSDLPHGYLSLYQSARCVFSDRVHTCAATLALGGTARYLASSSRSNEKRSKLFERLGVADVFHKPVQYDFQFVGRLKNEMRSNLSSLILKSR